MTSPKCPCTDCGAPAKPGRVGYRCEPCRDIRHRAARAKQSVAMKSAWARRKAEFSHEFRTPAEQSWRAFCTTAVRAAIRYGLLPSLDGKIKCTDCDAPAKCYDHRDYNRPIDVEPVCLPCNTSRHKGVMPVPRDFPRLEAA